MTLETCANAYVLKIGNFMTVQVYTNRKIS